MASGIFLGDKDLVISNTGNSILLFNGGYYPYTLADELNGIRFVTGTRYGEYIAFWTDTCSTFRLMELSGKQLWQERINGDKATPSDIHFADSGDAVACTFEFEGVPGLIFCDINQQRPTIFGCSSSPIGYDANLRYFVIDWYDPHENAAFYQCDPSSGNIVQLSPDTVEKVIEKAPLIVDRNRCLRPFRRPVPERGWDALAVKGDLYGFVILKHGDLHWIDEDSTSFDTTIPACLREDELSWRHRWNLKIMGNTALLQSTMGIAKVVERYHGIVWESEDCLSIIPWYKIIGAKYADGTVGVTRFGTDWKYSEKRYEPPSGCTTLAVDIIDGYLTAAYLTPSGESIKTKTYSLDVF